MRHHRCAYTSDHPVLLCLLPKDLSFRSLASNEKNVRNLQNVINVDKNLSTDPPPFTEV